MLTFILASGSPRRRLILEDMGITDYQVITPDIDETPYENEPPEAYVSRLSFEKAYNVLPDVDEPSAYILAADTTVIHLEEILGKPVDEEDARRMLLRLRGQDHRVCTGFTLLRKENGKVAQEYSEVVCTRVVMRAYSASDMERWLKSGHAYDKAGAYAIQSTVFPCVEQIEGSYSNVVGLPLEALSVALRTMGYPLNLPPSVQIPTGNDFDTE